MNTPLTPPQEQRPEQPAMSTTNMTLIAGGFSIIPIILGFIFALGAAVLSYRHFGSFGWAILDFIFPYFYYPYYAFVLDTPATTPTMFGGLKKLLRRR